MPRMRLIAALVMAVTMALLPVLGNIAWAGALALPLDETAITASHECCDHDSAPAKSPMHDCQAAAGCAFKCFGFYGPPCSEAVFRPDFPQVKVSFMNEAFTSQSGNPPFRPPRV